MRRTLVLALCALALSGCGGNRLDRTEVERLQDEVGQAARIVAITVSEALTATLPPGTTLGTGRSTTCTTSDGQDGAFYFVDTFVTHAPMDADRSLQLVAKELTREGYRADDVADEALVRAEIGDVVAEVSAGGQDDPPTGHDIFVTTGCLAVGADLADELVKEPGRDIRR